MGLFSWQYLEWPLGIFFFLYKIGAPPYCQSDIQFIITSGLPVHGFLDLCHFVQVTHSSKDTAPQKAWHRYCNIFRFSVSADIFGDGFV